MQRDRIKQRLEVISMARHCRFERHGRVVFGGLTQMVRLPVDDPETPVVLDDHVDESFDETAQRARLQRYIWIAVLDQQRAQRGEIERRRGEQKFELVQTPPW